MTYPPQNGPEGWGQPDPGQPELAQGQQSPQQPGYGQPAPQDPAYGQPTQQPGYGQPSYPAPEAPQPGYPGAVPPQAPPAQQPSVPPVPVPPVPQPPAPGQPYGAPYPGAVPPGYGYGTGGYGSGPAPYGSGPRGWNVFAVIGFIASFVVTLLGLIFSVVGLVQIRRTGQRGAGLAWAGIAVSVVGTIASIVVVIIVAVNLGAGARASDSTTFVDDLPSSGVPIGGFQELTGGGDPWVPEQGTDKSSVLVGASDGTQFSYHSADKTCFSFMEVGSAAPLQNDQLWSVSVANGKHWVSSAKPTFTSDFMQKRLSTFDASNGETNGSFGSAYATYTRGDNHWRGAVFSRVFDDGSNKVRYFIASVECDDATDLQSGIATMEADVGVAY